VFVNGSRGRKPSEPEIQVRTDRGLMHITFDGREHCIQVPY
jgi:hypothetical protein